MTGPGYIAIATAQHDKRAELGKLSEELRRLPVPTVDLPMREDRKYNSVAAMGSVANMVCIDSLVSPCVCTAATDSIDQWHHSWTLW